MVSSLPRGLWFTRTRRARSSTPFPRCPWAGVVLHYRQDLSSWPFSDAAGRRWRRCQAPSDRPRARRHVLSPYSSRCFSASGTSSSTVSAPSSNVSKAQSTPLGPQGLENHLELERRSVPPVLRLHVTPPRVSGEDTPAVSSFVVPVVPLQGCTAEDDVPGGIGGRPFGWSPLTEGGGAG